MSQKLHAIRSDAEPRSTETHEKVITSGNVYSDSSSDSDSESDSDEGDGDPPRQADPATLARFWSKVNKFGPVPSHRPELGRCWLWTANTVRGYGQFTLPRDEYGKQPHVYAHRFAYELIHGLFASPDIKACHHCDNRLCVRPSHVFAGSQGDNLADAVRKGRLVYGAHLIRVTDEGQADIRRRYIRRKNGKALAAEYGITLVSVMRIVAGTQRVECRQPFEINNVERVPTVELPIYELREFLQAPRRRDQSLQSVHVGHLRTPQQVVSMTASGMTERGTR
jgi:hypothetical protein